MTRYAVWRDVLEDLSACYLGFGIGCKGSRLLPTTANGCPAFGQYRVDPAGGHAPWYLQVLELTDGRGVDVAITATAAGAAQEQALLMLARQGRMSLFGGLPKDKPNITLDSNLVHYRELTLVGANGSSPAHNALALDYIATGRVPVNDLITHHLPLDDVLEGIEIVARGDAIKVTIEP